MKDAKHGARAIGEDQARFMELDFDCATMGNDSIFYRPPTADQLHLRTLGVTTVLRLVERCYREDDPSSRRQMPAPIFTRRRPMPTPTCPKCHSERVKAVTIWRVGVAPLYVAESPQPVWTCKELSCRHQWPRPFDEEAVRLQTKWQSKGDQPCAHPIQNLLDLSVGGRGPVMGLYYCRDCGKEIVRPYKRW